MKRIALHEHFDGAANLQYAEHLAGPSAMNRMVCSGNGNLAQYLTNFELPIKLMQTWEHLSHFASLMTEDLGNDNVIYAEIRLCPHFHTKEGLTMEQVVAATLEGLDNVSRIKTNIILCMMRELPLEQNLEIVELAKKRNFRRNCIVGLDLAGDEAARPNTDPEFAELFKQVRLAGIPFTIHAGEAAGPESIEAAIEMGAKRIGHGVRAIESENTVKMLADQRIPLEVCVTSNIDTGIYTSPSQHPIRKLMEAGVLVTINTDNRTVSSTRLVKEEEILRKHLGFTDEELLRCYLTAVAWSFARDKTKAALTRSLLADYANTHRDFGQLQL